jgi:transcriptional regulator with XRE-family HTH domain
MVLIVSAKASGLSTIKMTRVIQKKTPAASAPRYRNYLRAWRKSCGRSLNDMAKLTQIDKSALSRIENGHTQVYAELLNRYARALHIKPSVILTIGPPDDRFVRLYWRWLRMSKEQQALAFQQFMDATASAEEDHPPAPWTRRA